MGKQLIYAVCTSAALLTVPAKAEQQVLDCLIEPEMTIELGSSVDGIVDSVSVDKSDYVRKGDTLVILQSSVEKAAVELAKQRADMDDVIRSKEVNSNYAWRQYKRLQELHKKNAASEADIDQAATDAKLARLELETAKKRKAIAELELARAEAALQLRTIKAPVSGLIVNRHLNPGESVEDKPILKIAQIDPLRVEIIAPSELFGRIEKGMKVDIFPEAPAKGRYQAEVSVVDGIVDAASGTFGVRLAVPNPDNELFGGLNCKAQFALEAGSDNNNVARRKGHDPLIVSASGD